MRNGTSGACRAGLLVVVYGAGLLAVACGGGESSGKSGGSDAGGPGGGQGLGGGQTGSGGGPGGLPGAGGNAAVPLTAGAACFEYVRVQCETRTRCNSPDDASALERCLEASRQCPDMFLAAGSKRTPASLVACAEQWRTFPCEMLAREQVPPCVEAGTRQPGESCVFASQCASERCNAPLEGCGVCEARISPGAACDGPGAACERGYECAGQPSTCVPVRPPTTPEPPPRVPGLGEPCDRSGVGCGGVSVADCRFDPATNGYLCMPWPTLGQDCSSPDVKTCLAGDSYCDIGGTCLAFPAAGSPCGVDGWTGVAGTCADGLRCDTSVTPPMCLARPAPGAECTEITGCAPGARCTCDDPACTTTRHCRRFRAPGESCRDPADLCMPGASKCEGGTCAGVTELQGLFEARCPG